MHNSRRHSMAGIPRTAVCLLYVGYFPQVRLDDLSIRLETTSPGLLLEKREPIRFTATVDLLLLSLPGRLIRVDQTR